jgi:hypothetical protein
VIVLIHRRSHERRRGSLARQGRPGSARSRGAIDVDLSITPFTNTLPMRRLDLTEGQRADIRAVYLRLSDLSVTIDRQRDTCLKRGRHYRHGSSDTDFACDIDIDVDAHVVTCPGLFGRVL